MNIITLIILLTFIEGVCGTGIGGIIGALFKNDSSKIVSLLLSFAGGVMFSVVCFDLLPQALMPNDGAIIVPVYLVIFGCALGYIVIYLLNYIIDKNTNPENTHIDEKHPLTADDLDEIIHADHYNIHANQEHQNKHDLFVAGIVMSCAIALHNLPEGMVVGASYAANTIVNFTSNSGFILAVVIGLHNIPEGMSVSVPLISGGMKKWKAVIVTALSGLPEILGALIGYKIGLLNPIWLSVCLSFAGGAMLYVVLGELLPESFLMWRSKAPGVMAFVGTMLGLLLVNL